MSAPRLTPATVRVIHGVATEIVHIVEHVGARRVTLRMAGGSPRYYSLTDGYQYGEGYSVIHSDDLEALRAVRRG
mgnify:CR=1 FL=1